MGVVHLAQRPGGPRVALKVLRPHIVGDDEARRRLAREVGSLSRIRHPGVAEIVDADPWDDIPYVATRYVPGLSLHDHVREEGPITGADLVWFATRLGEALLAVHEQGVLHRDVKPSNVLMEGRTPILIDFGLARVADDPKLTHTGWLLGTPGYLAPEILFGDDATECLRRARLGRDGGVRRHRAAAVRPRTGDGDHGPRTPRRARPLRPSAARAPGRRRGPGPGAGAPTVAFPTCCAVSSSRPRPPRRKVDRPFEDDFFTTPLAVASAARADDLTRADPTWADRAGATGRSGRRSSSRPATTRAGSATRAGRRSRSQPKQPFPVRARTAALLGAAALAAGTAVGAYPYLATFGLVVAGLAAAQRLAGGVRGQQPADGARPVEVVRRPAAAPRHPVAPRAVDRGHAHARAVGSRPGHRGRPARLRLRPGPVVDARALRLHLHGRPVAGPGRPAGARAGAPRRRPHVAASGGLADRHGPAARRGVVRGVLRRHPRSRLGAGRRPPAGRVQPRRAAARPCADPRSRRTPRSWPAAGSARSARSGSAAPTAGCRPRSGPEARPRRRGRRRRCGTPSRRAPPASRGGSWRTRARSRSPAGHQLLVGELVGPRGRPRHDVGDPEPERRQLALLRGEQQPRGEAASPCERRPEAVARAREVVPGRRRHQPGVDAAEEHPQRRVAGAGQHVGKVAARRLELLAGPSRHTRPRYPDPRDPTPGHARSVADSRACSVR